MEPNPDQENEEAPESETELDSTLKLARRLPPTVARAMLGKRLRMLRENAGVLAEHAATKVGMARATLWRLEKGDIRCRYKPGDMELLAKAYNAEAESSLLTALATGTRNRNRFKPLGTNPFPDEAERYFDLEAHANQVRWYAPHLIPDPLQTAHYATAVVNARPGQAGTDLRGMVRLHRGRQDRMLGKDIPSEVTCLFVIDEAVLHRPVGSSRQMARQLREILAVSERPNVSVRVFPFDERVPAGLYTGPFVVLDFPLVPSFDRWPTAVYRDPVTPVVGRDSVTLQAIFHSLRRQALDDGASCDLIDCTATRFESD
jgi:transcriptional regulator with XRE-family HTH domain